MSSRRLLQATISFFLVSTSNGLVDTDGICSVFTFVPFTITWEDQAWDAGSFGKNHTSFAFSHMAAALLAQDHFNARNASMVPELADLGGCNVQLDLEQGFFDSGSLTRVASQRLAETGKIPCAIAGPANDYPGLELSVMAQAYQFPLVAHRVFSPRIASNFYSSFSSQVFPDMQASTMTLLSFLLEKGRTDFIAMVYSFSDSNIARRESLAYYLDEQGMDWMASAYMNTFAQSAFSTDIRKPYAALKKVQDVGYRTIVVMVDTVYGEIQALADAAEELGMNNGDYFWLWFDIFDTAIVFDDNANITKLVMGSTWIVPLSESVLSMGTDSFGTAWSSQGQKEVDRLNKVNPIEPGATGYRFAEDDFFQKQMEYGSTFMYDAVMSIGIGACLGERNQTGQVSGANHVSGIREANFQGASGKVKFGNDENDIDRPGVRLASTVTWGALNLRHPSFLPDDFDPTATYIALTDLLLAGSTTWKPITPYIYRDGRTVPPDLLRAQPEQNYLNEGLRVIGLTFMSIAMFFAVVSAIGVFVCRKHRVVRASQPPFMFLICFGALVQASTILTLSFDESYGSSNQQLGRLCMATPWLLSLGHIIIYSALFTKMWRVHKVLQFSRRQIKIRHVAWPMLFLVLSDLLLLSLWTALDPAVWERVEINESTGESIGECSSEHSAALWSVLLVLLITPMITTGVFAWKTRDVDEAYTESKYVFMMILLQVEIMFIGIPIAVLLQNVSTNGRYLGYAFMFWTFPMSTLVFIMLPKYLAYRRAVRGLDSSEAKPKRGERTHAKVSGFKSKESESKYSRAEVSREELPSSHEAMVSRVEALRQSQKAHMASGASNDEQLQPVSQAGKEEQTKNQEPIDLDPDKTSSSAPTHQEVTDPKAEEVPSSAHVTFSNAVS